MTDKPANGWPARGKVSGDGKLYTHTDGSVHKRESDKHNCFDCSLFRENCDNVPCYGSQWRLIEGAYVPSADELAACEAMREMIAVCDGVAGRCRRCALVLMDKCCPARLWLERCGQDDAWEVM